MTSVRSITLKHNDSVQQSRQKERLTRMTQVIQSFASGFTLRSVGVKLTRGSNAPAFSSSDRIWFNEDMIADLSTRSGVASLKGLTMHEIAHILLTPRTGSEIRQWVIEEELFRAFNALEDQRIESQLIALYPSIKDWFSATMSEYLLKTPNHWVVAFPLIHGRKYLDAKVRLMVKRVFKHQDRVGALARVIDEYRTLNMTDDADVETAKDLIRDYHSLTKDIVLDNPNGHDHRPVDEQETNSKSPTITKKKQREASERVENEPEELEPEFNEDDWSFDEDDEDESDDEDYDGDGSEYEDESDESDDSEDEDYDDSDADDSDEGDDSSDEYGDADDSSDGIESETGRDGTPSDNAGSDDADSDADADADSIQPNAEGGIEQGKHDVLENLLKDALDQTLDRLNDKIAKDIDLYNGDILLEGEVLPDPPRHEHMRTQAVSTEVVQASDAFKEELIRLRSQYDPAWERRVSSGRINAVRWEQGCEVDEAFDRFDMGKNDATDIEAVILLDISGSMVSQASTAYESMWAIKNALDGINASTSVVAWSSEGWRDKNSGTYTLYSADEKATGEMNYISPDGGTNPTKALQYAQGLLANSKRAIKLLIVITDGQWETSCLERTEENIRAMRDGGVLTSLAWLSPYMNEDENLHGAELVCHVRSARDLFELGRSIV